MRRRPTRVVIALIVASANLFAAEVRWTAKDLFDRSVTSNVVLTERGLELQSGVLVEDDGPAAGFSYEPNVEKLSDTVRARKRLEVARPAARSATLLLAPGGELEARLNGEPLAWEPLGKSGNYWQAFAIPPERLRTGSNDFEFSGNGSLWIAREQDYAAGSTDRPHHPDRSARSNDGGRTWNGERLGPKGDLDGEYYVRLFLDQHRPAGTMLLPVVDLDHQSRETRIPRIVTQTDALSVRLDADIPKSCRIAFFSRSGTTFVPDDEHWSDWEGIDENGRVEDLRGRFVQLRIELSTTDPLATPVLHGFHIEPDVTVEAGWTSRVRVVEAENSAVIRTSIPFRYERLDHPRLKQLRERIPDDVVDPAGTEFELIAALAKWSAVQWEKGHLGKAYPPWDALEILKAHADGTPVGGFCQQHNLLLVQACEAFGIHGRAVSLGPHDRLDFIRSGHEVVELWSNDFRKWVYVDGDFAWYAVDPRTRVPLSLLELRERQLAILDGREPAPFEPVNLLPDRAEWKGLDERPAFLELRLIPRSDFLERRSPLPLNQGMRGWFWTGHHVWTDETLPARPLYGHRIANRNIWEWTLNDAHVQLEPTSRPGILRVHVDTVTPGFDAFVAALDETPPIAVESPFEWRLKVGRNRFVIRSRNVAGREGPPTKLVLDYDPD